MTRPATKRGLPRHVLAKRLRDGDVAYYWNPPPWARDLPTAPTAAALGSDLAAAIEIAATLNAKLDREGCGHRSRILRQKLRIVPNGFLSTLSE